MRMQMILAVLTTVALAAPAWADDYPVSGRWGQSTSTQQGTIDCAGKRVIGFSGNQRTDSNGGVPAYRNRSVSNDGGGYRIVDEFTTGQISNAHTTYTLRQTDSDHLEMTQQGGPTLTLQRCK